MFSGVEGQAGRQEVVLCTTALDGWGMVVINDQVQGISEPEGILERLWK